MRRDMYSAISSFNLDWCKMIDTESGRVSDSYLAYYRLVKLIYHSITDLDE